MAMSDRRRQAGGTGPTGVMAMRLREAFPALTYSNYRYFWFGQCISLIGTWIQNTGQSWFVLTLTDSPWKLGLVGAMQFLPVMILSLFAGVIVDRFPKKRILLITQTASLVWALVLAVLVLTGRVQYWHILALAAALGITNAIDNPTRQAFMVELVGRDHLMNAVALNSSIFNAARIVGPAIAGFLIGKLGIGWCFVLNGLSFVPVILGILMIRPLAVRRSVQRKRVMQEIGDGLRYISGRSTLLTTVMLVAVVNIFAMNFSVLTPVLARSVLKLDASGYGFLMSAMGFGSLIGALAVAVRSRSGPGAAILRVMPFAVSALLFATGFARTVTSAAVLMAVTGLANILFTTNANSTMQLNSDDEYRGRAMSVYMLVFGGTSPIGNLVSGQIIERYGASAAYMILGVAAAALIAVVVLVERRQGRSQTAVGSA